MPCNDSEPTYSDRGFAGWPEIKAGGTAVSVYESSAAEIPHLWLSLDGEAHISGDVRPISGLVRGVAAGSIQAHLTMEQARVLRNHLAAAIRHTEERFSDAS